MFKVTQLVQLGQVGFGPSLLTVRFIFPWEPGAGSRVLTLPAPPQHAASVEEAGLSGLTARL